MGRDDKDEYRQGGSSPSMKQGMIFTLVLSLAAATWCYRDYWTGKISGRGRQPAAGSNSAAAPKNSFSNLPPDDKDVINWEIQQMRIADTAGKFKGTSDEEFRQLFAAQPEKLREARAIYDMAMEAEAERKSGRDFSRPGSPRVPLKWEALTYFQQAAVDHAVDQRHLKEGQSWVLEKNKRDAMRQELLKDPTQLQTMIDAYRASGRFKELSLVGRGK